MKRRCHACDEPALEPVRDQAMRGGMVNEHWRCSACETRVEVVGRRQFERRNRVQP
jgi:hypothetical protein